MNDLSVRFELFFIPKLLNWALAVGADEMDLSFVPIAVAVVRYSSTACAYIALS